MRFSRCFKFVNPANIFIVCALIIFIVLRIRLNFRMHDFVLDDLVKTENSEIVQSKTTESILAIRSESILSSNESVPITTGQRAYSAKLEKTYSLEEFNRLTKDEFITFNGIGEVTAQAILDYISEFGPFTNFDDLLNVKGIGEKKLKNILNILP